MGSEIKFGHPLYGAELRLARARQLIGTMRRQQRRWAEATLGAEFHQEFAHETGHLLLRPELRAINLRHVPRISITLGETVYNIRAALDYLVYSIVRASNGAVEIDETQFPLSVTEEGLLEAPLDRRESQDGQERAPIPQQHSEGRRRRSRALSALLGMWMGALASQPVECR